MALIFNSQTQCFQEAFSGIDFQEDFSQTQCFSRSLQWHSVCFSRSLALGFCVCSSFVVSYQPCPLLKTCQTCYLSKLSANFPHQPHQPLKHIKLSTCHHDCSEGQLLTFFSAFLSAMQCPACGRMLPKSGFANSLWRWQQGSGWLWCCKACKNRWIRRRLRHGASGKTAAPQNSLRNTPWLHCASFMFK